MINSNKAIELIKEIIIKYKDMKYDEADLVSMFHDIDKIESIIKSTENVEVIKDSHEIVKDLTNISTCALNRDYCWGCKLKLFCDIKGSNAFCKGYYDILYSIEDILDKYE